MLKQGKQAVNQQQDNNLNVQTVQIGKHVASFLVPDYNDGQKLSVIDDGVLKHLKNLLPKASSYDIVKNFRDEINTLLHGEMPGTENLLEDAVKLAKDFVAFHTSINLIKQYFDPKVTVIREEPFNVEPPKPKEINDMTVDELNELKSQLFNQIGELKTNLKNIDKALDQFEPQVVQSAAH